MGLLAAYRRFWAVAIFLALASPALLHLALPRQTVSEREARNLAPLPSRPQTRADWVKLPRAVDAYLGDHFGLRDSLVRANAILRHAVVSPTSVNVIYGRDRWLLLNGDGMIEQAMGLLQRKDDIARFADFAASLHAQYRAQNVGFLVTMPPNSTSIERDKLPSWWAQKSPQTEYDAMLQALAARDVPALDLRPALRMENKIRPVYRRSDTHWNKLGALVAYNEVVSALGKNDWRIAPEKVFRGYEEIGGGDLARMLGAPRVIGDTEAAIDLSSYAPPHTSFMKIDTGRETGGNLTQSEKPGPTIVVLGDSFTEHAWRDYFALHAGKFVWIHHELCDFRPDIVAAQKPDIVIFAPTERFMFCWNKWPPQAQNKAR